MRRKGKRTSVVIHVKDYQQALQRLEDAKDVALLKLTRKKPQHYGRTRIT